MAKSSEFKWKISQTKSPDIVALYSLDVPTSTVKSRIRFEFLKNIQEKDTRIVDRLLFQGRLEFEETMNQWKQKNHVMNYFDQAAPKQKSFMDDFYSQGN